MPAHFTDPSQPGTLASPWPDGHPESSREAMVNGGHLPFTYRIPYSLWKLENEARDFASVVHRVVAGLAEAANAAQIADVLPAGELRSQMEASADAFANAVLDDYCGTRPPWPGPTPWAIAIASDLSELANIYQAGFLRDELLRIAALAMQKAAGG